MLKNQTNLLDGTVYDLIFIGQDLAGNQTGFITTPNITYDITLPVFTILDPIDGAYANYLSLSYDCLLYTSPSPRDRTRSRMPSSA